MVQVKMSSALQRVLCLLCFIWLCAADSFEKPQFCGHCRTPHNETGRCLRLADCPQIQSQLCSGNTTVERYLRRSQCGYDNRQSELQRRILVCCPVAEEWQNPRSEAEPPALGDVLPEEGICGRFASMRVYGGNVTKIGEYPWMVLIKYRKPNESPNFHCGGSLINSRYVLTAAHCMENPDWTEHSVRLGEWNLETACDCDDLMQNDCSPPALDVAVEKITLHNLYRASNPNKFYDIALLRLERYVHYTQSIRPICLPVSQAQRNEHFYRRFEVAGWGLTEDLQSSPVKLKIQIDILNTTVCHEKFHNFYGMSVNGSQQLCAGGTEGVDTCLGDSGGSLMLKSNRQVFFAVGIVSYGPYPCGLSGWPGVYTMVGSFIDWIRSNLDP